MKSNEKTFSITVWFIGTVIFMWLIFSMFTNHSTILMGVLHGSSPVKYVADCSIGGVKVPVEKIIDRYTEITNKTASIRAYKTPDANFELGELRCRFEGEIPSFLVSVYKDEIVENWERYR